MSQLLQTPFGRHSTASEVIDGVDLSGKRAVVTGAGSGIGTETARALASAGAEVVLAVRRPQAAGQIAAGIAGSTGNTKVSVRALDLADQDSVCRFAAAWDQPLHILVSNAGIMALPELERTPASSGSRSKVRPGGSRASRSSTQASRDSWRRSTVSCLRMSSEAATGRLEKFSGADQDGLVCDGRHPRQRLAQRQHVHGGLDRGRRDLVAVCAAVDDRE